MPLNAGSPEPEELLEELELEELLLELEEEPDEELLELDDELDEELPVLFSPPQAARMATAVKMLPHLSTCFSAD